MFQVLARESFCREKMYASLAMLFTYSVIIMAVGASRMYRSLVDHPIFNKHLVKGNDSMEWPKELESKTTAPLNQGYLAEGTRNPGGTIIAVYGQPFMMLSLEVEEFRGSNIV
jgi:hypothetical protein